MNHCRCLPLLFWRQPIQIVEDLCFYCRFYHPDLPFFHNHPTVYRVQIAYRQRHQPQARGRAELAMRAMPPSTSPVW